MDRQRLQLLYTIYFLAQYDLARGAAENLVRKLIGITEAVFQKLVHDLITAEYLSKMSGQGNYLVLSQKAITLLNQQLSVNRVLILQITNPQFLPPTSRLVFGYRYNYYFSENGNIIREGTITVLASDVLSITWQLSFNDIHSDTVLLLLLFAKDHLIKLFNDGTLSSNEQVELLTGTQPPKPPYAPEDYVPLESAKFVLLSDNTGAFNRDLANAASDATTHIDQLIKYNRSLEWYTNATNIPNQKLVSSTLEFIRQHRPNLIEPLDFLNLLYKQIDDLKSFLDKPDEYLQTLKTLPISEELRYTLYGMILKWHGGYPVNNLNPQYNAILQEIEKAFLAMNQNQDTPEKEFCAVDKAMQKRLRDLENEINRRLGNPVDDTPEELEPIEQANTTPKEVNMNEEGQGLPPSSHEPEKAEAFPNNIVYHAFGDTTPVMGVTGLAADYGKVLSSMQSETGQMIGIFGKWGRGKTFFLKQLSQQLKLSKTPVFLQVDFHAWKYQETPASWAYLYEQFVAGYLGKKVWWWPFGYYWRLVCLNIKRNGLYPILFFLGTVTLTTMFFFFPIDAWYLKTGAISGAVVVAAALLAKLQKEYSLKAINLIKKYQLRNSFKSSLGIQADIQDELIKLLKVWIPNRKCGKKKIILVVEDIDRCNQDKIIENIDSLRVLLDDMEIAKRVLIITAIDERILKDAILMKYKHVLENRKNYVKKTNDTEHGEHYDLITEYMDKLFISAIKLGDLSNNQIKEYMLQLIKNDTHDSKSKDNQRVTAQTTTAAGTTSNTINLSAPEVPGPSSPASTPVETGTSLSAPMPAPSDLEAVTQVELSCFEELFEQWVNPTPRKMRIFYYRYLLSKNQLIGKYDGVPGHNIWLYPSGIRTIMKLIHFYSQAGNLEILTKDRRETWENTNEVVSIPHTTGNQTVPRMDLLNLLEVLELTIAY